MNTNIFIFEHLTHWVTGFFHKKNHKNGFNNFIYYRLNKLSIEYSWTSIKTVFKLEQWDTMG